MFNYTISIIEKIENKDKIERVSYTSEKAAKKVYKGFCIIARCYVSDIVGLQLWQHQKGKTIDNDPHARIIRQYYK